MARKPKYSIDLCIRTRQVSSQKGERLNGYLGVHYYEDNSSYIFLGPIRSWVEKYAGAPAPEHLLAKAVIEAACHETLHSLIRSRGPNAEDREHKAISRLMAAIDLDWRY